MTTSRTSRPSPRVLLTGLLLVLLAGVTLSVRAFAFGAPGAGGGSNGVAAVQANAAAALSQSGGSAASANVTAATPTQAAPSTQHQWDAAVPGITNDPVLASRLDQALSGVDGHVGVAVKDLGSGRGAVLNGDLELQSASLYKLTVLYTVFQLGLSMSEEVPITEDALQYDSGTMELGPGETLSVAELLERMITLSDNTSGVMLGSRVGAANINANLAALGMDTTHYSLDRMTTSALDMLHLSELIADGKAVSPLASADMLHLMLRQRVNDRLPRLLSDDVQVAHKTGNLPGVVNDVGILYGPNSTVAVAALVSDTTDETTAATAIAQIGQTASSYFEDQPPVQDRPEIPAAPDRPIPPVWREPHPPTPTPRPVERVVAPTTRPVQAESSPTLAAEVAAATPTVLPTVGVSATPTAKPAATATQAPQVTATPTKAAAAPTATSTPAPAATPPPAPPPTKPPAAQPTQAPATPHATPAKPSGNTPGATVTPVRH